MPMCCMSVNILKNSIGIRVEIEASYLSVSEKVHGPSVINVRSYAGESNTFASSIPGLETG